MDCVKYVLFSSHLPDSSPSKIGWNSLPERTPSANLHFFGMFDSNGLGPIAAWVVDKWERRKDLISYSRMMMCMWFYGIHNTWLVCSCVCVCVCVCSCVGVKCSIYISFDINILACLLKIYSGVYSHIHFTRVWIFWQRFSNIIKDANIFNFKKPPVGLWNVNTAQFQSESLYFLFPNRHFDVPCYLQGCISNILGWKSKSVASFLPSFLPDLLL